MSDNVESQIVSMQFDNKQFESGVATSIGTLDKLKSSLAFPDAGKGLDGVNAAARGFNLHPMASAIQGISKKWIGLTTVAVTAISNITNKVVDAGLRLAKSFTIDPITQGFQEYSTNLNSIQTIMSNTGKDVDTVNKYLNNLNHYSDKTIYNFSEMAKNIGTFTAAGVDLKTSTESIKGIANLAALSGSNSQQASSAMYQLSQAIAAGKVGLQDWNSVVNAGIGGAKFQRALADTAVTMGTLDKSQVKVSGSMKNVTIDGNAFRNSLTPPPGGGATWLTSGVLTSTLEQFTGDLKLADLTAQGFTKSQALAIIQLAKTSQKAATRVKTFSQVIDVAKETIGSGWAKIFQDLFGDFNQSSKLFTNVSNTINGAINTVFHSVNRMLQGWRKLGGYDDLWTGLGNIFKILGNLIQPFVVAFQEIFPSAGKAGAGLAKVTKGFADFTGFLVKVTDGLDYLTPVIQTVFGAFRTGAGYVGIAVAALQPLVPLLQDLSKYVGDLAAQGAEIASGLIGGLFEGLNTNELRTQIESFANNIVVWIKETLGIHSPATTMIPVGFNIVQGIVEGIGQGAKYLIQGLGKIFAGMGQALKYLVQNINYSDVLDTINSGLFLGLVLLFRKFVTAFTGTIAQFQDIMGKAGGVLDQVTSNLKTMQSKVKSDIIRNIAISVALLAGAALLLSTIDTKKLGVALGAIAGLMVGLIGAMKILTGGSGKKSLDAKTIAKQSGQILAVSTAMISFSTAILILTGAVAIMGKLDPKTIERGLAGVAGVIALITTATAILGKTGGGGTILATAVALTVMAGALTAFVGVMKLYEQLDWKTLVRGGGSAAAVILAVGLAMRGFGKGSIGGSVGLLVASAALIVLAKAMQQFASIGLADMVKSVVALDIILGSLAAASIAMSAAEGGASSLLVMSAALIVLAKALEIISKIPFLDLVKAIGALVVSLALIAGAAVLLTPAVPLIAALGSALLLLGLSVLAAGVGILAFATAMGILAVVGPAAFQAIHDGIGQLLEVLPQIGEALGEMVVSFFTGVVKAAGPLTKALGKLLGILIDAVTGLIPKLQKLVQKLINAIFEIIVHSYGHAAKVMIQFVVHLLDALQNGVPKMIQKGSDLIIAVVQGLGRNGAKIANATGKAILQFLKGLDAAIVKYEPRIIAEGIQIGKDLVNGLVQGIKDGLPSVTSAVSSLAHSALDTIKNPKNWHINSPSRASRKLGAGFSEGAAMGISDGISSVEKEASNMANTAFSALRDTFSKTKSAADGLGDLKPKITPVLDLTQLQKDASKIGGVMGNHEIKTDATRRSARDVAASASAHKHAHADGGGDTYEFVQNNYSPKPINHVKAYRGTKSLLALQREVTGK